MDLRSRLGLSQIIMYFSLIFLLSYTGLYASANNTDAEVVGNIYEFPKDSHYEFHESKKSVKSDICETYGTFKISGDISVVGTKNGVPSYEIEEGDLSFFYNYEDKKLNADLDSWHLVEDSSRKVADIDLASDIKKGTIIVQTSKDRKTWLDSEIIFNAFSETPIRTNPIYSTSDIQLINGCYYRVIVVYELSIRTEISNFLFFNTDKYDFKKLAEVYEFYAYINSGGAKLSENEPTYSLGERVKAENFDGYFGEKIIDKTDVHYGWELGNFFVSGYTDEITSSSGNVVFLKNVGDKVTLWFNLNQNINGLNGKDNLSITADMSGYDQYFETPRIDFGRGVLIIRYTDHNNVKAEPTIYTNYLEANTTVGADTKVQLFEEGDYEVALNYEVTSDEFIDQIGHYRIFFKFSVRNGNCMVYPFDVATGSELTNSSMTENGFRLDLAKSRYLKINLKREVLKDSADGLVEDTRFNGPAKDGAEYTDEGVYTITVSNEYTNQFTVKKIYVGTNNILRAYMTTGLSIPEINNLIFQGATILDDGTIQLAAKEPEVTEETIIEEISAYTPENVPAVNTEINDVLQEEIKDDNTSLIILLSVFSIILFATVAIFVIIKKPFAKKTDLSESDGGAK